MLAGFGIGGVITPSAVGRQILKCDVLLTDKLQTVAMMCCPDSVIAITTGLSLAARTFGGALGITVYSTIFQNKIIKYLPMDVAEYALKAGLPASSLSEFLTAYLTAPTTAEAVKGVTPYVLEQAALGQSWAYAHSLRYVWYTSIGFGIGAAVCCLFIPNIKRRLTNQVAVVSPEEKIVASSLYGANLVADFPLKCTRRQYKRRLRI